ncbi:hypothetical protein KAR26_00560 [Candidatus Parcubacteria bacterium]|nr:hypothetical protein [Candidatus Parcubacteria bacterium]
MQNSATTQRIVPWRILLGEVFLFSLTLGLGLIAGLRVNEFSEKEIISLPQVSLGQFILQFILAVSVLFFILFIIKQRKKKKIVYKSLFVLTVWWGGTLTLNLWLSSLPAMVLMGLLVFWWHKQPLVLNHNICLILGLVGAGVILGLTLDPYAIVWLLVLFSIYDFIAVYKTKHMVKMAREMIEHKAILALIIPQKISDFGAQLEKVRTDSQAVKREFLILGGGDVVFPMIFCISLLPQGINNSLIVAVFSLIGLLASFWLFIRQENRKPIPALPPIALSSLIGFLITLII